MNSFSLKTKPNQHLAGRYDTNQKKKKKKKKEANTAKKKPNQKLKGKKNTKKKKKKKKKAGHFPEKILFGKTFHISSNHS